MLSAITKEAELRALIGGVPADLTRTKVSERVNDLTRQFVERSPFLCLATSARDGTCDVRPRGDPEGGSDTTVCQVARTDRFLRRNGHLTPIGV
jgi:predicted pyridoxine 5'-phosphate oxidase superfamily flavin-nucleotide-binding protein